MFTGATLLLVLAVYPLYRLGVWVDSLTARNDRSKAIS